MLGRTLLCKGNSLRNMLYVKITKHVLLLQLRCLGLNNLLNQRATATLKSFFYPRFCSLAPRRGPAAVSSGCRHLLKLSRLESVNRTAQPPAELGFCQRSHGSPTAGHHSHRRSTCRITGVPSEPAALKDLGDASRTWCEQRKQGCPALSVLPRQLSRDTPATKGLLGTASSSKAGGKGEPCLGRGARGPTR